jgi:hypothetical protein
VKYGAFVGEVEFTGLTKYFAMVVKMESSLSNRVNTILFSNIIIKLSGNIIHLAMGTCQTITFLASGTILGVKFSAIAAHAATS